MTTAEVDVLARAEAVLRKICAEFPVASRAGSESDRIAAVEESGADEAQVLAIARQVQSRLFDAGLAWPTGPAEFGGLELEEDEADQLEALIESADLPTRHSLFVGLHIVAPAILEHGTSAQRHQYLPALFTGMQVGCQLFSEPGAGSDLAGVTTKAVRDGDDWVISGQKVWTSHGHVADIGEALVRTDSTAAKHAGMTMFMVDMHAPGVTVRPLRQITGGAAFNEVFLDEVRVPDSARIGAPGEGWRVALTSLSSERGSMGGANGPLSPTVLSRLAGLIEQQDGGGDPFLRVRVAQTVGAVLAMHAAVDRADDEWLDGIADVSGSVQKMLMTRALDQVSALAADLLGHRAFVDTGVLNTHAWSEFVLGVPGLHLAGGTDEIQRGLIANRGLRLPR